jgi:flavodoxin
MNTFVIYDSQFGNTEQIAKAIVGTLHTFGQAQAVRVDPAHPLELQGVDLLILGCPTQGFRPTPAMLSFLGTISNTTLSGLAVACFDTRFRGRLWKHSAAQHIAGQLHTMGVEPLLPPESFFVKFTREGKGPLLAGEVERAASWASSVHQQYEAQAALLAAH